MDETRAYVQGFDDSRWEPEVDENALANEGILHFGIDKLSEGVSYKDPTWESKKTAWNRILLPNGGFHYFHPQLDAAQQAVWCYQCGKGNNIHTIAVDAETPLLIMAKGIKIRGELGITKDLLDQIDRGCAHYENHHIFGMRSILAEAKSVNEGASLTKRLLTFRDTLHLLSGWKVILYSSPAFINAWIDHVEDWELWLAHYTYQIDLEPMLPIGWSYNQIIMHQWTDKGKSAGFPNTHVDLNKLYGTTKTAVTLFGNGSETPVATTTLPKTFSIKSSSTFLNLRSAPTYPDSNTKTVIGRLMRLDGAGKTVNYTPIDVEYDANLRKWWKLGNELYCAAWLTI